MATVDNEIRTLSGQTPSGPDFCQPTIDYTSRCVKVILEKITTTLSEQFPAAASSLQDFSGEILNLRGKLKPHGFRIDPADHSLSFKTSGGSLLPPIRIVQGIFRANPALGIDTYIECLYYASGRNQAGQPRFPGINSRYKSILENTEWDVDRPEAGFLAAAYATQVGKILAVEEAKNLLQRIAPFAGVNGVSMIPTYLESLKTPLVLIRGHESYIMLGLGTMKQLAERRGIDEDRQRLLLDLAFIKSLAFTNRRRFQDALHPIYQLLSENNWDRAMICRDFLLRYFADSFPEWRVRDQLADSLSSKDFDALARAISDGRVSIAAVEIPDEYKDQFAPFLNRKIGAVLKQAELLLFNNSLQFATTMVSQFGKAAWIASSDYDNKIYAEMRFQELLKREKSLKTKFANVWQGLTDYVNSNEVSSWEFATKFWEIDPRLADRLNRQGRRDLIEVVYDLLSGKKQKTLKPTSKQPVILRQGMVPDFFRRSPLRVELIDGRQMCVYRRDSSIDKKMPDGSIQLTYELHASVAQLIKDLVIRGHLKPESAPYIEHAELVFRLQEAYQQSKHTLPPGFTVKAYIQLQLKSIDSIGPQELEILNRFTDLIDF